jgi:putative membrane protein
VTVLARAGLSALHILALALGFASLWLRGLRLRELAQDRANAATRSALLRADNVWGLAALLWIATGLARVFAGEKTTDFYMRNGFFWVKMSLFLCVFLLELRPMLAFIRWRLAKGRGGEAAIQELVAVAPLEAFRKTNDAEVVLVLLIPFAAALMARAAWLF